MSLLCTHPPDSGCSDGVVLPRYLVHVLSEHGLGGVEALLVAYFVLEWSRQGLGDDERLRIDASAAARALDVGRPTIDAALRRLAARGLIAIELYGAQRFARLTPLHLDVGGLWPDRDSPDAVVVCSRLMEAILGCASRGRDALLLLLLVVQVDPRTTFSAGTAAAKARALHVTERAAQLMAARLVARGVIRRAAGGFDLGPLVDPDRGATLAAMNIRYNARVAEILARGRGASAP